MRAAAATLTFILAVTPGSVPPAARAPWPGPAVRDSALAMAREALSAGWPWRATRLLAPLLKDSATRTPEVELVAATAAAGWHGWREADDILRNATWLDTSFGGAGREVLARANLGLERDSIAAVQARAAVRLANNPVERGVRLVLLGRALEGARQYDSAATAYRTGADLLPLIRSWLYLRAIGTTRDSAARAALTQLVTDSLEKSRVAQANALALVRTGDTTAAIRAYDAAGSPLFALRLRAATVDAATRRTVGNDLVAFISERSGSVMARSAVATLDSLDVPLAPAQQLIVARSSARSGPLPRAGTAYAAAFAASAGSAVDRMAWADVLFRQARYTDAIAQYRRVTAPPALAAAAGYRIGRSMVRDGRAAEGVTQLKKVASRWPADTSAAAALYLLADLAIDDSNDALARTTFQRIGKQYPASHQAAAAAFRAAIIAYADAMYEVAAGEFDAFETHHPNSSEGMAALYWSGRSWAGMGDTARARVRWQEAISRDSVSYYADAAAHRLGVASWQPTASPDTFSAAPDLDAIALRADMLDRVMLDNEALAERARLGLAAGSASERLLTAADLMRRHALPNEAISLARRAQNAGAPRDARLYRLLYPLGFPAALEGEAVRAGVDPPLVAALTRQESLFDPDATSAAGARGLMQVMPDVGKKVAHALGYPEWDPVLLYQADANLEIGSTHLRALLDAQGSVVEVLAAYNAGAQRVARWRLRGGAQDPELLTERIPFVETRDYVRIVQRNRSLYRVLYNWPAEVSAVP